MMISASAGTISGDRLRLDDANRRFDKAAGDGELIDVVINFLRGNIRNRRHAADAQRRGHFFLARAIFFPMHVDALPQFQRRIAADPVPRLDHRAIGTDVVNAVLGILGDVVRRADVRRVIPTWRRDRHRDTVDSLARFFSSSPVMTISWTGAASEGISTGGTGFAFACAQS